MTVQETNVIDFVSIDPVTGMVLLSLVEERDWGFRGSLLPDLQSKLNTYLEYVEGGQLVSDYPEVEARPVTFRLHYAHEPSEHEREFIRIVVKQHLGPRGIAWEDGPIRTLNPAPN